MAFADFDVSVGHSFGLDFDGIMIKAIQEVSGLKIEQDVIEMKENTPDGQFVIKKLPGRQKAGEVTLTRGLSDDNGFEKWIESSCFGQMADARKNGSIIVFDYESNPIKRYTLTNAWPKSLEIGSLKAGDTNVLTEKLVVVYEAIAPEG